MRIDVNKFFLEFFRIFRILKMFKDEQNEFHKTNEKKIELIIMLKFHY